MGGAGVWVLESHLGDTWALLLTPGQQKDPRTPHSLRPLALRHTGVDASVLSCHIGDAQRRLDTGHLDDEAVLAWVGETAARGVHAHQEQLGSILQATEPQELIANLLVALTDQHRFAVDLRVTEQGLSRTWEGGGMEIDVKRRSIGLRTKIGFVLVQFFIAYLLSCIILMP